MAVGVYSAVHGVYVKNEIAMTGEISIHGEVKPVGGVYAKIKAAKKAGSKMVLIPAENMQPILYSIKGIEIVPVRHMKEVLARAIVSAPSSARTSIEAIQSSFNEGDIQSI
jgi:Lon-like ATP-dependent protease